MQSSNTGSANNGRAASTDRSAGVAFDLYFTSAPVEGPHNAICASKDHRHFEEHGADTMHNNVAARWMPQSCEDQLAYEWTGGAICAIHKWEVIDSLQTLVDLVAKRCGERDYVRVLRIKGHGNGGSGFWITSELVTKYSLASQESNLRRLGRYLVPGISLVLLEHCKAGRAEELLKQLSQFWGGVAVMASRENQVSHLGRPKLEEEVWDNDRQAWITVDLRGLQQPDVRADFAAGAQGSGHPPDENGQRQPRPDAPDVHALPRRDDALGGLCGGPLVGSRRHRGEWKNAVGPACRVPRPAYAPVTRSRSAICC
ncbi:MAG: hypothetical protein HY000_03885 [Planctomycetes bacterium]|nr:hypothetical protein [Planctomycetota bacterium]